MMTNSLRLEAQAALDELMQEHKLPFNLEARKIASKVPSQYTIHFYDARLRSITVVWEEGQSFKEIVRTAVLDRVSRLSGPLNRKNL
jgi:hypothetical protein